MPDILIRGLKAKTVERLKARAKRNGRSLQSEAKQLIERSASQEAVQSILDRWKKEFGGKRFTKSTVELIREDRER